MTAWRSPSLNRRASDLGREAVLLPQSAGVKVPAIWLIEATLQFRERLIHRKRKPCGKTASQDLRRPSWRCKRARLNLLPPQAGQQELEKPTSDNEAAKKAPPRLHQPAKRGQSDRRSAATASGLPRAVGGRKKSEINPWRP